MPPDPIFAPQRLKRLTPPETALAQLLASLPGPVAPRQMAASEALGFTLAEDVPGIACPPVPLAIRDGWAVASADTLGAGPYAPLTLPALWAESGDPLPPGTDALLPPDALHAGALTEEATPGAGARQPGEDIASGTILARAGSRLTARQIPALTACGIAEVSIRAPRIAWIAVGDEIAVDPALDGLRALLAPLIVAEGTRLAVLTPAPDAVSTIAAFLAAAAPEADLILLAGGTGEGRRDLSAHGLAEAGTLLLHGIGAAPGMSAGFGTVGTTPVILLPGRAEDGYAAWLLLARPAVRALAAAVPSHASQARLTRKVASRVGLAELVPLRCPEPGLAEPVAIGAFLLAALAQLDAVLLVPPGSEGHEAGTLITLMEP